MLSNKAIKSGRPRVPNRQGLYSKTAKYAVYAIEKLVKLMDSKNENISLGASRTLLDKCLPDQKAVEYNAECGDILVRIVEENKQTDN